MKVFAVLDMIKKKIYMKMVNYDCNKFVWIVALLKNIGIFIQKNNSIMQKQQIQTKINSSAQENIKISTQVEFVQCNFFGTIISQMCSMDQNNYEGYRINDDFTAIVKNQNKLPSSHCLGCWNYKLFPNFIKNYDILAVKEGQKFPITGQFFVVIGLLKNPTFIQQIMDGICAVLNAGGGYLILNSSTQKKVQGISQKQFQLKDDSFRAIQNASRLIRPSSQNPKLFRILPQIIWTFDNPIHHIHQEFQQFTNYLKTIQRKFIIIVTILPRIPNSSSKIYHPTLFYQQQQIKSNKFTYPTYIYQGNTIKKIEQQHVYNLLTKYAKKKARSNFGCLGCAQLMDKNIKQQLQKIQSKQQQQSDLPNVTRYKNCTVIVITSLKYQQEVSQKIKNLLAQKKLLYSFKKPYTKYTSTSLRPIWYINHIMEFNQLNSLINTKIDESLYRAIVVTNFLKLRGYPDSQRLSRMKNIICTKFNLTKEQQPYLKTKHLITGAKMNKTQLHYFYKFLDFQHSILAFIYLDGVSVKCEFVKQAQFPN